MEEIATNLINFSLDDAGGLNLEYDQSKNSSLGLLPGNKLDLEDEMPTSYSWQSVPPTTTTQPNITAGSLNISEGFPWERIILGEVTPAKLLPDMSNIESWRQDPSFCSGKISARSTSFGPSSVGNDTRDENFSDFSKPISFQGSYLSSHTNTERINNESVFHSGGLKNVPINPFSGGEEDTQAHLQAEFGQEFSDIEFGNMGGQGLRQFLDQEEEDCLKEHQFLEEEQIKGEDEGQVEDSNFSGVSDRSIVLRNSNLWGGDTSNVNLHQLRKEGTKMSRCEYFRHNSSRLGSLEDSILEEERPALGFFHHIRSPERQLCPLLSRKSLLESEVEPDHISSTFNMQGDSDSAPSSANSTFLPSGDSTKTVISLLDQSGTLKAADLASKLEDLAKQLGNVDRGVENYIDDNLEAVINKSLVEGSDVNLSTISKVLSDASLSSDPQHFVNVILGCLKYKAASNDITEQFFPTEVGKEEFLMSNEMASDVNDSFNLSNSANKSGNSSRIILPFSEKTPLGSRSSFQRIKQTKTPPSSQITPNMSKRAMMRLTPSSAEPISRVQRAISKPIKPFNKTATLNPVAPVRPQPSRTTTSLPSSVRPTPLPNDSMALSNSVSSALDISSRQRRPSGARHSSPIKKMVTFNSPEMEDSITTITPLPRDLSRLLDSVSRSTPTIHMSSSQHLTTSTPFHQGHNLSTVILDNLTHNVSLSPLIIPDTFLTPVDHDLSSSDGRVNFMSDWTYSSVLCSHVEHVLQVPVNNNMANLSEVVVRVTEVTVNSTSVPSTHWERLITCKWETVFFVKPEDQFIELNVIINMGGMLTLNLNVGNETFSSSGLVRIQVEEPDIQVLTDQGTRLEFGCLPEECRHHVPLVLVNCGLSDVPLVLELREPNNLFSLEGQMKRLQLHIPGVEADSVTPGQGVAKETTVEVSSVGLTISQPMVVQTELLIYLGGDGPNLTLLGSLDCVVKVSSARLRIKRGQEPVHFNCSPGQSVLQNIQLSNSGLINLNLNVELPEVTSGKFSYEKVICIPSDQAISVPITFTASTTPTVPESKTELSLNVVPGGPKHLVSLHISVGDTNTDIYKSSKPSISMGKIRHKEENVNQYKGPQSLPLQSLPVFPVESDRSQINFLNVGPEGEEQIITLRNSTDKIVTLNLIIREADNFFICGNGERSLSSQCIFQPDGTQDVRLLFCPQNFVHRTMGKLVLKPQGRKLEGKSVKATINLLGVSGKVDIKISGDQLKELEHGQHHLLCNKSPAVRQIKFSNQGEVTGFVKFVTVEANVGITPDKFLLDPGQEKEVNVSVYKENLSFSVFTGSELVRQVMKRCFLMPGANKLFNNSALDNVDFTCQFPGEGDVDETVLTSLTVMDVVHFFNKTVKNVVRVSDNKCDWSSKFRGLTVEETLSETRIDQSIALPMVTRHQATGQLVLLPSHIQLDINCEMIVRLQNHQSRLVHWDLTWPTDMIDCTPKEGSLAPCGQSVICVQAIGSPGHQTWRGQVMVYSDNGVDKLEVTINPSPATPPLLVTNRCVDLGTAVVGSTTNGMVTVTNTSHCLVQWSGLVEPSFFSLSQPGGILNPGQSVNLGVQFKPPVPGNHSTTVSLRCVQVKGGQEGGPISGPVKVTVAGKAVSLKEAALSLPSVVTSTAVVSKKGGGSLSLETDLILFPDTAVGEVTVAKVKLKNRSGSDQEVEIVGQGGGHFKTVHSVATVKSQCFCTVPVQFRPTVRGTHSQQISFRWGGENIITATLRGKAI